MDKMKIFSFLIAVVLFGVSCNGNTSVLDPEFPNDEDLPVFEDEEFLEDDDDEDEQIDTDPLPVDEDPVTDPGNDPVTPEAFVQCLADAGVVVYGSNTCPACTQFANSLGGYDVIAPIYVECTSEWERCSVEMQGNFVPEIQINGVLYEGSRAPEELALVTGCEL